MSADEQADMWKKDAEEFFKLEEERKQREKELSLMHVEILKNQMREKQVKKKKANMNNNEARMNKELLKKIHKGASEGSSEAGIQ